MTEQTNKPVDEAVDDQDIEFVRGERQRIVKAIAGTAIPVDDSKKMAVLLSALDGIDRSAIARKRIRSEDKAAAGMSGAAALIAKVLTAANPLDFIKEGLQREAPVLGSEVKTPELVPGETHRGTLNLSYEEVMAGKSEAQK
jgi:hypothetical protein